MNPSTSRLAAQTEAFVEALATRLHHVDLVGWAQITAWAEKRGLSFEDLRLLLALRTMDGLSKVSDLARLSGLSLDAAYPCVHRLRGRRYLHEERRRYALSESGRELVAGLDVAHREGIQAYVEALDAGEREQLLETVRIPK